MTVQYEPVVHDYDRTMEQQAYLLAKASECVWRRWMGVSSTTKPGSVELAQKITKLQGIDEEFDADMRALYRQLSEMDVFMGGVHENEE